MKHLIVSAVILAASQVSAHPDHGPLSQREIDGDEAQHRAARVVELLADKKLIEQSWSSAQAQGTAQRLYVGENTLWRVRFYNASAKDADKQFVYVFLSSDGQYRGANHSGQP